MVVPWLRHGRGRGGCGRGHRVVVVVVVVLIALGILIVTALLRCVVVMAYFTTSGCLHKRLPACAQAVCCGFLSKACKDACPRRLRQVFISPATDHRTGAQSTNQWDSMHN